MKLLAARSWSRIPCGCVMSLVLSGAVACQPPPNAAATPADQASNDALQSSQQASGASASGKAEAGVHANASPLDNPGDGSWWSVPYPAVFDATALLNTPARVSVKGNRFVDEQGNTLVFHGVNISDPDKLARDGHWSKRHFEAVASWGADIVRIPVHPAAWRGRGKAAYFALLDDAVQWANELNLYLIIDWHSIGNLRTGMFQHPMHNTTITETNEFWRAVSHRYAGVTTVAFYELFNEPTLYNGTLGSMTWNEWRGLVEEMISIIHAHDPKVVPLVGGFNWAYDLSEANKQPINRKGIGYVSHPYPEKTTAPFEKNWDHDFGVIAKRYPLFATEIGYMAPNAPGAHVPVKDDGAYGKRITDYLDKKGASWTAWCFEPEWPPQLIADWNYTPTEAGTHFRSVMLEKAKIRATNQQLLAEAAATKKAAQEQKRAAEEEKAAEKRAAEEKKAAEKRAAEEEKAAEKRAAEEKKAAERAAAEEKKAAEKAASEATQPKATPGAAPPVAAKTESVSSASSDQSKPIASSALAKPAPSTTSPAAAPQAPSASQTPAAAPKANATTKSTPTANAGNPTSGAKPKASTAAAPKAPAPTAPAAPAGSEKPAPIPPAAPLPAPSATPVEKTAQPPTAETKPAPKAAAKKPVAAKTSSPAPAGSALP